MGKSIKTKNVYTLILGFAGLLPLSANANTIGNDFQKLNPTVSGIDYTVVESSKTIEKGKLKTGVLADYSTNVLPVIEQGEGTQSITSVEDYMLSSHLYAGYGLLDNLEVGVNLPFILTQSDDETSEYKGQILSGGLSYMGASAKYQVWSNFMYGLALGVNIGTDLMTSNPYIGDTSPVYFTTYAAGDAKFDGIKIAINAGYKYRSTGEAIYSEETLSTPIEPFSGEFIFSGAGSYELNRKSAMTLEIYGSIGTGTGLDDSDRDANSVELLSSYKQDLGSNLDLTVGAGTEILHGVGSADLRIFAGISMEIGVASSSSRSSSAKQSSSTDEDVYGQPSYEEPSYEETEKVEEPVESEGTYNIEETELPTFDDPEDYSL